MAQDDPVATTRAVRWIAAALAILVAIAFPATYLAVQYRAHATSMEMEALFGAATVSSLINSNPELWMFEEHRLQGLLRNAVDQGLPEVRRILDAKGAVVVQGTEQLDPPTGRRFAPLLDSGNAVGRFEVTRSMRPLLLETALVGLFGMLLGGLILWVLHNYPLRALKRALTTLADEKTHAELILDCIADGVVTIDLDGVVRSVNPAAEKMFGYAPEGVAGHHVRELIAESARSEHSEFLERHMRRSRTRVVGTAQEVTGRQRNGDLFPMELHVTDFYLEDRRHFLASLRDITERRQARDEVLRLNADLEERVRKRTAQLQAANEELQAFSYSISHDLRAPLSSIGGFVGLLGKEIDPDRANERTQHYFTRIRAVVAQMSELIDSLLLLAKVSRATLLEIDVDLSAIAQTVLDGWRRREPTRQVEWEIEPGLTARGDPPLLRRVLENLLGNAWKFTRQQPQARIDFRRQPGPDGQDIYVVQDNGAGFDIVEADKLFSPFHRLHSAQEFAGSGIGLAVVERVIARHGGKVWGESSAGQGARFYFTLGSQKP